RTTMRYIEVNAAGVSISGFSREEILAAGPQDVLDTTAEALAAEYDAVIACSEQQPFQSWIRCKDGSRVPVEINRQALRSGDDWVIVSVSRDITERRETEVKLQQLAYYDTLTGLPNRRLFQESLQQSLEQADALGMQVVLMFLDVDNFKNVNDSLGHSVGDELLRQVGKRLLDCLYVRDHVGRLGGDEFAVSMLVEREASVALIVSRKIHKAFEAPFEIEGHVVHATVSIGITIYPLDTGAAASMMRFADLAMYSAKQAGRDTSRFYTAAMNQRVHDRLALESALRGALARGEFLLHYQPKICLRTGEWTGVEALLRWQRPGHGLVSPGEFVPALEATGLVVPVGDWVLDMACRQLKAWKDAGLRPLPIAVNVSALQLARRAQSAISDDAGGVDGSGSPAQSEPSGLPATAMAALQRNDIGPDLLEIEITESTVMTDAAHNVEVLRHLRALGIRLSVDDFGTGYSSLAYLRRLPLDALKIDGSFIRDLTADGDDAAITLAIIEMAHRLNLQVIAECVETDAQLQHLRAVGCDEVQGYYLARPMPVDVLEALWRSSGGRVAALGGDAAVPPPA
ncbi:MAG TPA: EAL domain-containing protein, partial [Luteimonas sp.]|nr:EAL domain-containing protein [Luteimonas sp.]